MSTGAHSQRSAPTGRSGSTSSRPTGKATPTGRRPASSPTGPKSAAHRRRRQARRIPVAVAALIAATIVGTSFPASALLAQHRQLSAASAELARVQHQNALLADQERQLNAKTEIQRLAREDYQLVLPGQSLYNVLPAAGQSAPTAGGVPSLGDPADQPLVPPADAPDMSPDPGLPATGTTGTGAQRAPTAAASGASNGAGGGSFWHRVTATLEFWK